jgi:L-lactate permease
MRIDYILGIPGAILAAIGVAVGLSPLISAGIVLVVFAFLFRQR